MEKCFQDIRWVSKKLWVYRIVTIYQYIIVNRLQ